MVAIAAGFLLAGTIGAVWWNWARPVEIDAATYCPLPEPTAVHAVLVDRSDPISANQLRRVREVLDRAVSGGPVGARVALYVAEADDVEVLTPRMVLCNPGTARTLFYPDPAPLRERYDQAFRAEIDRVTQELQQRPDRSLAPVMEAVRAVCLDSFARSATGGPLSMTIIGDMAQYSRLANHHADRNYEALLGSQRLDPVLTDCKSAEVDILYLQRPTPVFMPGPQGLAHRRFWELFLQKMKARPRNIELVPAEAL
ncbi:MAG TPA: hypothetical protein VGN83_14555 [Falsiroseomonas sp.]|jgi:hypothetical protein|nr:hypothetical protein [Falsiroseomonas sp.]